MTPSDATKRGHRRARSELVRHWEEAADRHLSPTQQSLIVTWTTFAATFAGARVITHGIRDGWLPWGNVALRGRHLHHYNFGIAAMVGVGLVAVRGDERAIRHPGVAAAYGVGGALIADEFALLLDLEDVYWTAEGRKSVDAALGVLAVLGLYLTAVPFWHEIARVTHRHVRRSLADREARTPGDGAASPGAAPTPFTRTRRRPRRYA